jgi:hypothetical protein
LHIFGRAGIADRTVREDLDRNWAGLQMNWDHPGDESATSKHRDPIFPFARDTGTGVISFKFDE